MNNNYMKSIQQFKLEQDKKANTISNIKNAVKNPLAQYIVFGVILIAIQLLQQIGKNMGVQIIPVSFVTALGSTMIYAIVAIGFCLLLGYSGLASLGTAGFIGIGVYVTYYCLQDWGMPYIVALIMSLAVSIVLGVGVGFISLRIEGIYLAIITLGLSEILRTALQAMLSTIDISLKSIKLFGVVVPKSTVFYLMTIMLVALMIITSNLMRSPTGRAMLAIKNSTSAAQSFGMSLMKYRLLAFVISTCFASIAGIMYAMYFRYVSTSGDSLFTLTTSLNILGAVIIGGYKSIWGALSGTFIMYGIQSMFLQDIEFFRTNPTLITFFIGILIILVVMFLPGGLAQLVAELKYKLAAKKVERRIMKYGE